MIYEQIPRSDRAAKHRNAALWIERISERVTDHAEILIHHYGQALQLLQSLGSPEGREALEESYRRFLMLAGDRALQLDVGRAEGYFARALELVPPVHSDRATVLTKAAEAATLAGRYFQAEGRYEEAIAELRVHVRTVELGGALVNLSIVHALRGETARARTLLDDAVGLLGHEPPGPELARAYAQMARRHTLAERWEETLTWSHRALALPSGWASGRSPRWPSSTEASQRSHSATSVASTTCTRRCGPAAASALVSRRFERLPTSGPLCG